MALQPVAMVAFEGSSLDDETRQLLTEPVVAGVTLFEELNMGTAEETHQLTADIQRAAKRSMLIAIDQEGGQLIGAGKDTTPFAGNMALGAAGDADLAMRVGVAIGAELRALGINVNYAPVADVASQPDNPSMGIRSFGSDAPSVAKLTGAMVEGLQSSGVAATLKHFPGKGEAKVDPHYRLPVLELDIERLERVEFPPFRAGVEAGAKMMMVGHYGLPAVTGDSGLPTSASSAVIGGLIRRRLGFEGLVITDALDMAGFGGHDLSSPLAAGVDLLLFGPVQAGSALGVTATEGTRLSSLLEWLDRFPTPAPSIVGCAQHHKLADELATRSITLVRDRDGLLPLQVDGDARLLAVMPQPLDLTPAENSSRVAPGLAAALRQTVPMVTEIVVDYRPDLASIDGVVAAARDHDLIVIGTLAATPEQAAMVTAVESTGMPMVTVALHTPYDLALYPQVSTHVCTYGIHPPSMNALANALFGRATLNGRLPVALPGLYAVGHRGTK